MMGRTKHPLVPIVDDEPVDQRVPYSLAVEHGELCVLITRGVCQRCGSHIPLSEAVGHACKVTA